MQRYSRSATPKSSKKSQLSVPRRCTLEGFTHETSSRGGVEIGHLRPLTKLNVQTHNSFYQVTLLDPTESTAIVQGGRYFREPSEVYLCGSSYGGTLLKTSWIGYGMRLEIMSQGRRVVTSPVLAVDTVADKSLPGPC
jgi:hypothetical protein